MSLRHRRHHPLVALVLRQPVLDFRKRRFGAVEIGLIHDHNIGRVEHHDFLQLQTRAVIRIHHQDGLINQFAAKRERFLTGADRLDDHVIKIRFR